MAEPYLMASFPQIADPIEVLGVEDQKHTHAWYAVQTAPRHEKKVAQELRRKEIDAFLPLFSERHQWRDRDRIVEVPLFPQYVFVRIRPDSNSRITVLRTAGVAAFVGSKGVGTVIPETQISAVRSVLQSRLDTSPCSYLEVGKRVRIYGGSL